MDSTFLGVRVFPQDFTWWALADSNMLVTVVGALATLVIGRLLSRQIEQKDNEITNEAERSKFEVEREDAEAKTNNAQESIFLDGVEIIARLKDCVEAKVETSDGRNKRVYDRIPRYDYTTLVEAMKKRGLDEKIAALLTEAFNLWRPYRTGRRTPNGEVANRLRAILHELQGLGFCVQ